MTIKKRKTAKTHRTAAHKRTPPRKANGQFRKRK
jgi:hypothetical protein